MKRFRVAHSLRTSLWLVPVLRVLVGVVISFVTMAVDDGDLIPQSVTGGPDAALMILGSVATSMVTLTGLVLTIVLVVVQLAMGQFSPRIVRAILRDRAESAGHRCLRRHVRPLDAGHAEGGLDRAGRPRCPGWPSSWPSS